MGKTTRKVSKERLEVIKQHTEWMTQQEPLVAALAHFADKCMVFAPAPTEHSTGEFDHKWHVSRAVIVPDYCEEAVTVPANSVRLSLMSDHGKIVSVGLDPLASAPRRRYADLASGLEVVVPGGAVAKMEKKGEDYTVKEAEDGEG